MITVQAKGTCLADLDGSTGHIVKRFRRETPEGRTVTAAYMLDLDGQSEYTLVTGVLVGQTLHAELEQTLTPSALWARLHSDERKMAFELALWDLGKKTASDLEVRNRIFRNYCLEALDARMNPDDYLEPNGWILEVWNWWNEKGYAEAEDLLQR